MAGSAAGSPVAAELLVQENLVTEQDERILIGVCGLTGLTGKREIRRRGEARQYRQR